MFESGLNISGIDIHPKVRLPIGANVTAAFAVLQTTL